MVNVEKALASRRRAREVTLAEDDEIAAALRSHRRALRQQARAQEALGTFDRRPGTSMVRLVELGVPVAGVAARIGLWGHRAAQDVEDPRSQRSRLVIRKSMSQRRACLLVQAGSASAWR